MSDSTEKRGWWGRLTGGLKRTSSALGTALTDLVSKRKLDAAMVEEIEEALIRADLGVAVAGQVAEALGQGRYDKAISADEVKAVLAAEVEKIPGLTDINVEQQTYAPQQRIVVDYQRAALFGITPAEVTAMLATFTNGRVVSQVIENGRRFDVVVRLRDEDRTADALGRLRLDTPAGSVPLSSFASIEANYGPSRILREDGVRRIALMIKPQVSSAVADEGRGLPAHNTTPCALHASRSTCG